ncbi:hypothetical protein CBR_g54665 [Chara braunii]|uniref:HAT C-terminal dimerisation domain-containing protein n=1 Tax=Chara braunii TaxID=69332 RepID=A0A388MCM5_CHABU|nr:hypothetical protein CBR_g54665 [Chara braunii]|eukprot:GBG92219.1 hypothetical protein CBR_g54665 [Chara braunii]
MPALAIWRKLHKVGAQFPLDILERVQRAMEENPNDDDDAHAVEDITGSGGEGHCVGGEVEEAAGGHPLVGGDECTRGEVTGGGTAVRTLASSQVERRARWAGKRALSFKKFTLACYGPQPTVSHSHVPTGYNLLGCRLLNRLRERLESEEHAIRDDWEVTGCTFITDGTTDICGRSLMNFILAGRLKPVFIKCEDVSEGDKDSAAVIASWKRDIVVFSNVELMTQFESVVDRLIGKRGRKKFTNCMDQLYDFQFGNGVFGSERAVERASKDNAVLWWEAHGAGYQEIKALAIKVLSIWTTSFLAERNWSSWALVKTKPRNTLHHQRTEKLVYSHLSLKLKSRGGDDPTVAGGWFGLAADWDDEDLEGGQAGVTDAVHEGEVAYDGTRSATGSTSVHRDPFMPGTSASAKRLGEVGKGVGTEEVDVDEEEEDFDDEDGIPGEKWEDERSDSDRSLTRREEITPYIPGTQSGLRS